MGQIHRKMSKVRDVANNIVNAIIGEKREVVEGKFLKIDNRPNLNRKFAEQTIH